jgi:hypothetical protein
MVGFIWVSKQTVLVFRSTQVIKPVRVHGAPSNNTNTKIEVKVIVLKQTLQT